MKLIRPSKKIIIMSGVLVVLASVIAFAVSTQSRSTVEVYTVEQGYVIDSVEETAVVKARDERVLESEVNGTLETLQVEPGDRVSKGEVLAVLDIVDVDLEIAQLEAQRASLAAEMEEAKRVDSNISAQLDAEKKSAYAAYETSNRAYEQNLRLFESGAISTSTLSDSKDQMTIDFETYKSANQVYIQQKKGLSEELQNKYQADLKVLDYRIQSMENKREKFEIKAPFDGIVTEKYADVQEVLTVGSPVLEIVDESSKYLETDVLASDAGKLEVGSKIVVNDDDVDLNATGTITKVFPKAFSKTSDLGIEQKRVRIEMVLDQSMENLKMGYEMDVDVIMDEQNTSLRIPDTAAFKMNREWHVFVVKNHQLEVKAVEIGLEGQDYFEVLSGLEDGDQVVISPENELEDGERVSIVGQEG